MYLQSRFLLSGELSWSPAWVFVFAGTLTLYGLHRLIGLRFVTGKERTNRFRTIAQLRGEILLYTLLAGLATAVSFFHLSRKLQISLLLPGLLALLYPLPVFRGKRLRDLPYIKIFLIAAVWTWISVCLPAIELQRLDLMSWLMTGERAFFLFGITLPFDLRDQPADKKAGVKTLINLIDPRLPGSLALLASFTLAWSNYQLTSYTSGTIFGIGLSILAAMILLWLSPNISHDYFFSGLIDGLMILQFCLVYVL